MKLISLNVEGNKHWERIMPFLERERPDVLCLQELFDRDAHVLKERFGYEMLFEPMTLDPYDQEGREWIPQGIGMFSTRPFSTTGNSVYYSPSAVLERYDRDNKPGTCRGTLLWASVEVDSTEFLIATTHLAVTADGQTDPPQTANFNALLDVVSTLPPHSICGDFNMPRGYNDLYPRMIAQYADRIPEEYACSLDLDIHRGGKDLVQRSHIGRFMVDYIFTQPPYTTLSVRLQFGVSDHAAVIGELARK